MKMEWWMETYKITEEQYYKAWDMVLYGQEKSMENAIKIVKEEK